MRISDWSSDVCSSDLEGGVQGCSSLDASALASLDDGSLNNRIQLRFLKTNQTANALLVSGGGAGASVYSPPASFPVDSIGKLAVGYSSAAHTLAYNGSAYVSGTTSPLPVGINRLYIGLGYGVPWINGHVRRIRYYPRRLPDSVLQALTA